MYLKKICSFAVLILLFMVNTAPVTLMAGAQLEGWSEDIRLTFNDARSVAPAIAVEGNNIHVVYGDNDGGGKYDMFLWYINSSDCGITWNPPRCLISGPSLKISSPKIAVNRDNIHVIWKDCNDEKIHYFRSLDNGITWSAEKILTPMVYPYTSNWDIDVYENNLHIVYIDSNNKLSYIQSNDNGVSWSNHRVLIPSNSMVIESAIAVNGNNVHVAFRDTRDRIGNIICDIFYIRSSDAGANWDSDIDISLLPGIDTLCGFPDIAVVENNIFVVYRDNSPGRRQIYLSRSNDNGVTWDMRLQLSNSTSFIVAPAIAAENKNVCIVWEDFRSAIDGDFELYYKSSYDGGLSWDIDTRLTKAREPSDQPDIVINENTIHVTWYDYRDGNAEIYYKQRLLEAPLIPAIVDIKPDTLNLKSKGRWITAYIMLPKGYDVNDIDISTVLLEDFIPAENHPFEIGDYNNDEIPDLMAKFDRSDVEDILTPSESVTLKVNGSLGTDRLFEGDDNIRVIRPL